MRAAGASAYSLRLASGHELRGGERVCLATIRVWATSVVPKTRYMICHPERASARENCLCRSSSSNRGQKWVLRGLKSPQDDKE